jgi:hypothetical protein
VLVAVISQSLCTLLAFNMVIAERLLHLPPLFVPPEAPFHAYWRMKGDLLVYGLMMPFQVGQGAYLLYQRQYRRDNPWGTAFTCIAVTTFQIRCRSLSSHFVSCVRGNGVGSIICFGYSAILTPLPAPAGSDNGAAQPTIKPAKQVLTSMPGCCCCWWNLCLVWAPHLMQMHS